MLTGALAVAWLGQEQPALLAVLRQRFAERGVQPKGVETACQLLAQFLHQVARQQAIPTIAAADVEQALLRRRDAVDPAMAEWIADAVKNITSTPLATPVAGPMAQEIAQLMQAVVGILLDPTSAIKSA